MFLSIENTSLFAGQWLFLFTQRPAVRSCFQWGMKVGPVPQGLHFSCVSELLSGLDVFWFVYVGFVLLNLLDLFYGGFFTSRWAPVTICAGYSYMMEKVERLQNSIRFCCVMDTWADIAVMNESVVHMTSCFCTVFVLLQWLSHRVRLQRGVSVAARSPVAPFPSLPSPQARRTCLFSTHASSVPVRPHDITPCDNWPENWDHETMLKG